MMKTIFSLGLLIIVSSCAGYTGWYFGHIHGFTKAKDQYSGIPYTSKSLLFDSIKNSKPEQESVSKTLRQIALDEAQRRLLKQQVAKMSEKMRKEFKPSQQQRSQSASIVQLVEKNSACRWTVGRLIELQRIIKTGGKGGDSQFCEEYFNRVSELKTNNCQNSASTFSGFCG